ncbi:MAG: SOS response-associated peptidase [Acidimicrobiales bacterium]
MCGRFSLYEDDDRVDDRFDLTWPADAEPWRKSWNIAPTQRIAGILGHGDYQAPEGERRIVRTIERFRWGLLGPWVSDPKKAGSTFNARAETVATKATFRAAFRARRLLVPANSYFEWQRDGAAKQAQVIQRADGDLLAFAGLWQEWHDPQDKSVRLLTATIVTTAAGPDTAQVHDRQPVVLAPEAWDLWLDPDNDDAETLQALLQPSIPGTLVHYPVGPRAGNIRNNDPGLVEPLSSPEGAGP